MRSSSHNVALQETARAEASTVAVGLVAAVGPAAMSAVTAKTLLISEHGSTATSKVHTAPASAEGVDVTQPRGFTNLGNTCFANSVMQALMSVPAAKRLFDELHAKLSEVNEMERRRQHLVSTTRGDPVASSLASFLPEVPQVPVLAHLCLMAAQLPATRVLGPDTRTHQSADHSRGGKWDTVHQGPDRTVTRDDHRGAAKTVPARHRVSGASSTGPHDKPRSASVGVPPAAGGGGTKKGAKGKKKSKGKRMNSAQLAAEQARAARAAKHAATAAHYGNKHDNDDTGDRDSSDAEVGAFANGVGPTATSSGPVAESRPVDQRRVGGQSRRGRGRGRGQGRGRGPGREQQRTRTSSNKRAQNPRSNGGVGHKDADSSSESDEDMQAPSSAVHGRKVEEAPTARGQRTAGATHSLKSQRPGPAPVTEAPPQFTQQQLTRQKWQREQDRLAQRTQHWQQSRGHAPPNTVMPFACLGQTARCRAAPVAPPCHSLAALREGEVLNTQFFVPVLQQFAAVLGVGHGGGRYGRNPFSHAQQDAQEFLSFVLDRASDELRMLERCAQEASEVARELVLVSDAGPSSAGGGGELGLGLEVNDEWTEVHSGRRRGGVTRTVVTQESTPVSNMFIGAMRHETHGLDSHSPWRPRRTASDRRSLMARACRRVSRSHRVHPLPPTADPCNNDTGGTCGRPSGGRLESVHVQPFCALALDIPTHKTTDLAAALRYTLSGGQVHSEHGYSRPIRHSMTVHRLPAVLLLQLKRFAVVDGYETKLSTPVSYGTHLDFPKSCCSLELQAEITRSGMPRYKLHAVVVHHGNSLWSGHYTAYVLREAGSSTQWYHINDDYVQKVGQSAAKRQAGAYLLVYSRVK